MDKIKTVSRRNLHILISRRVDLSTITLGQSNLHGYETERVSRDGLLLRIFPKVSFPFILLFKMHVQKTQCARTDKGSANTYEIVGSQMPTKENTFTQHLAKCMALAPPCVAIAPVKGSLRGRRQVHGEGENSPSQLAMGAACNLNPT